MSTTDTAKDRIAFLRGLNATRTFRPDPVPEEAINDILQVARWSGSASNVQPWEFLVIRDRETLQKLDGGEPECAPRGDRAARHRAGHDGRPGQSGA